MSLFQPLNMFAVLCVCLSVVLVDAHEQNSDLATLGQSGLKFATSLYKVVSQKEGNLLMSPLSIHCVLTMLSLGARADTAQQMNQTLRLPSRDVTSRGYKALLDLLKPPNAGNLSMANNIYPSKGVTVVPKFLQTTIDVFDSEIQPLDFNKAKEAVDSINNWVAEKTNQKIKDILDSVGDDTTMVLVSALYFKGAWYNPFKKLGEGSFTVDSGVVQVPTIHVHEVFYYKETNTIRVLELPYYGHEIFMFIMIPKGKLTLKDVEREIEGGALDGLLDGLSKHEVFVEMPTFRFETTIDLEEILTKMGMPIIFDKHAADFMDMISSPPIYVDKVVHKTFIEVNENGTEAAAATAVRPVAVNWRPTYPRVEFLVDEPFIYLLQQLESGQVLFLGRCVDPRK